MVLSTPIPRAMLKINIDDVFNGIPHNPIIAAVSNNGIILGINDIHTILNDLKVNVNNMAITTKANIKEYNKFLIK